MPRPVLQDTFDLALEPLSDEDGDATERDATGAIAATRAIAARRGTGRGVHRKSVGGARTGARGGRKRPGTTAGLGRVERTANDDDDDDPPVDGPTPDDGNARVSLRYDTLPDSLVRLGNETSWTQVLRHWGDAALRHRPILLSGPSGCGKTEGVHALATHVGLAVRAYDGSDSDHELARFVRLGRKCDTALGPLVVLLDDVEGFTDQRRREILDLVKTSEPFADAPLVITCNDARALTTRALHEACVHVALRAGPESCVRAHCARHHVWEDAGGTRRRGFGEALLAAERDVLREGDLRRAGIALEWRAAGVAAAARRPAGDEADNVDGTAATPANPANPDDDDGACALEARTPAFATPLTARASCCGGRRTRTPGARRRRV